MRTDRANHRPVAGDSEAAESIKLLARTHQSFVWERQRHVNRLRSALREFYPAALEAFGTELASTDAVAVLTVAPTLELGHRGIGLDGPDSLAAHPPAARGAVSARSYSDRH